MILGSVGTPPCSALPASADCIGSDGGSHTLGSLHFDHDGTLFVGVGDGSDGDANSLRAQDLNSPNGKILRINPDGTAPADNPFYDGTNSWRSRVWLYGVRNPFGFTFKPRPKSSGSATSGGTRGRRSTTEAPGRTSAGRATRATVRSRSSRASSPAVRR